MTNLNFQHPLANCQKFAEVFPVCAISHGQTHKFTDEDDLISIFMAPTILNHMLIDPGKSEEKSVTSN